MAAMILKAPPQCGQRAISMSKTRLSEARPAHARRHPMRVLGWEFACILRRTRHDHGTQPRMGCEHTVKRDQMQASCTYRIALRAACRTEGAEPANRTRPDQKTTAALCAEAHGFSLHAAV